MFEVEYLWNGLVIEVRHVFFALNFQAKLQGL